MNTLKNDVQKIYNEADKIRASRFDFIEEMAELDAAEQEIFTSYLAPIEPAVDIKLSIYYALKGYNNKTVSDADIMRMIEKFCDDYGTEYTIGIMHEMPEYNEINTILAAVGVMRTDIN